MTTPLGPGDDQRLSADIKVHLDGTTCLVDVGVGLCPGTPRLLTAQTPGRAAAKYGDQSNFVPFIVETGGRINAAGLDFFDTVSGRAGERRRTGPGGQARGAVRGRQCVDQTAGLHVGADRRGDPCARPRGGGG